MSSSATFYRFRSVQPYADKPPGEHCVNLHNVSRISRVDSKVYVVLLETDEDSAGVVYEVHADDADRVWKYAEYLCKRNGVTT